MAMAADAPFDNFVLLNGGATFTLNAHPMDTVKDLKEKINDKEGTPVHQQRLSIAQESQTPFNLDVRRRGPFKLSKLNIVEGTTLLLRRRRRRWRRRRRRKRRSLPPSQPGRRLRTTDLWHTHIPSSTRFKDGRLIATAVMELIFDPTKVMPIMQVVDFAGDLWCRSNRRLLAYRAAAIDWLEEGLHFEMVGVRRHFIGGLSLTNLDLIILRDNDSPLNMAPWLWREILACHDVERARERRRLARANA